LVGTRATALGAAISTRAAAGTTALWAIAAEALALTLAARTAAALTGWTVATRAAISTITTTASALLAIFAAVAGVFVEGRRLLRPSGQKKLF
jgi:hypothetical protein